MACPGWDHMRLVLAEIAWGCPGGDHMRLVLAEITRGCPGGDHMRLVLAEIAWGCPGGNHMRLVLAEIMWSLDIHVHLPMLSVSIARVGSLPNMISTRTASYDLNQDGFIWSQPWLFYYFCKWFMELINTFQSHLRWFLKIIYYFFQSDKKSERDLWRGYIVGVARVRILTTEGG
jgi:hypothetical protein